MERLPYSEVGSCADFFTKVHPITHERQVEVELQLFFVKVLDQAFDWLVEQLKIYSEDRDTEPDVIFDNKER